MKAMERDSEEARERPTAFEGRYEEAVGKLDLAKTRIEGTEHPVSIYILLIYDNTFTKKMFSEIRTRLGIFALGFAFRLFEH